MKSVALVAGLLVAAATLAAPQAGAQTTGVGVGGIPSGIGPGGSMSFSPGPSPAPSATLPGAGLESGGVLPSQPRARGRGARSARPASGK